MTIDLANALAERYNEVVLMAGLVVPMNNELNHRVKIRKICRYNRRNRITRAFSWIFGTAQVLYFLKMNYRGYELFFSTNPPILIYVLLFLKAPFSIIIWDLYPDILVTSKMLEANNPFISIWAGVNRKVLGRATVIFTLTEGMARCLGKYCENDTIRIVPAWSAELKVKDYTNSQNPFIKKYQLENKFIVMYSGNLGKEHELVWLIDLAERLNGVKNIVVVIAGSGWKHDIIKSEIENRQLHNCILLPKQPVDLFQAAVAAIDIGVVSLSQSASLVSIPSKTYNLLAAGKPVLCLGSESSDLAHFLKSSQTGATFSSSSLNEMADFVLSLQEDNILYSEYRENALKVSLHFTAENARTMAWFHSENAIKGETRKRTHEPA